MQVPSNIREVIKLSYSITSYYMMFAYSELSSFAPEFYIPRKDIETNRMFEECINLISLPNNFKLPSNFAESMFRGCINLTSDISNIWPDEWTSDNPNLLYMFYNCSKVTGTVPANKLWNSGKIRDYNDCFYNCTSLTNYNEIPDDWK